MPGPDPFHASPAGAVIERALDRGRLAHALLLHGAESEALEGFARRIAARLLDLSPDWAASAAAHPDYFTLRPSGKSRQIRIGKDAADPNSMRSFIRELAQSPLSAARKVGVVFEAERLNPSSANAFLKTLEEPPLDTTILLLTGRPYSLLPTIRSRCLSFRLPAGADLPDDPVVQAWLQDYAAWLRSLAGGAADRRALSRQAMTVFALVARFARWLEGATAHALGHLKESGALENLEAEETDALKASTAVGVRQRFLTAVETATCTFARECEDPGPALAHSVRELEHAASLLRLNFNDNAALELFLLHALRAWSRRGG